MAYESEVWWRPGGRSPFSLDPGKPRGRQLVALGLQLGLILGGPLVALIAIGHYPPLVPDSTIYIGGLGSIVFWFVASFALFGEKSFPRGMPRPLQMVFRAGFGLCTTGLTIGVIGIVNGYATPVVVRDAAVVAKRQTLERDPANRTNYLVVRAWPGSSAVVGLPAPIAVYNQLAVPVADVETSQSVLAAMADAGRVRLSVGQGRLGLGWLASVSLP